MSTRAEHHGRLETLQEIARSAEEARAALARRDMPGILAVAAERHQLLHELQELDACLKQKGDAPAPELRRAAEILLRQLVDTERELREDLRLWRDETRAALLGVRRARYARERYEAAAANAPAAEPEDALSTDDAA